MSKFIEDLNLSDNMFTYIPIEIGKLHQVRKLKLNNNKIRRVSDILLNLPFL